MEEKKRKGELSRSQTKKRKAEATGVIWSVVIMKRGVEDRVENAATKIRSDVEDVHDLQRYIVKEYSGQGSNFTFASNDITVYECAQGFQDDDTWDSWTIQQAKANNTSPKLRASSKLNADHCYLAIVGIPRTGIYVAEDVAHFWGNLYRIQEVTNVLRFPDDVDASFMWGARSCGRAIFVRDCYRRLWDMIKDHFDNKKGRGFIVTGTPGIGKSYFLFYILYRLMQLPIVPTIVFKPRGSTPYSIYDPANKSLYRLIGPPLVELSRPDAYLIVDGESPTQECDRIILLTSPNHNVYHQFNKDDDVDLRYMPLWTRDEIEQCRMACYPHWSQEEVEKRGSRVGLIPRYVFGAGDWEGDLNRAISKQATKGAGLVQTLLESDRSDDFSDRVIHLQVRDETYRRVTVVFASEYVGLEIARRMNKEARVRITTEIKSCMDPEAKEMLGVLLENLMHSTLAQGGTFSARPLSRNERGECFELVIPQASNLSITPFSNLANLNMTTNAGEYAVPVSRNFAAIDSLIVGSDLVFQITLGLRHEINRDGILKIYKSGIVRTDPLRFCFIVPDRNTFNGMKEQPYMTKGKNSSLLAGVKIDQIVVHVPLVNE